MNATTVRCVCEHLAVPVWLVVTVQYIMPGKPAPFTVTWDKTISKANKAEGLLWRREQPPQPRGPSQPRWLPVQQRSRRWFRPGSFVGVRMGPWLKQAKLSEGGPPAPPLPPPQQRHPTYPPSPFTCSLPTSRAPGNPGDGSRVGGPVFVGRRSSTRWQRWQRFSRAALRWKHGDMSQKTFSGYTSRTDPICFYQVK